MNATLRWKELLTRTERELDKLAESHVSEVRKRKLYLSAKVSDRELKQASIIIFRTVLYRLQNEEAASPEYSEKLDAALSKIGRQRARQGVSVEDLMAVVRANFIVLWRHFNDQALDDSLLVHHLEQIYEEVEQVSFQIRTDYMRHKAIIEGDSNLAARRLLDELFAMDSIDRVQLARIGEGLGLDLDRHYCMLVAPIGAARVAEEVAEELMTEGRAHWLYFNNAFCVFWPKSFSASPAEMVAMLKLVEEWCVVNPSVNGVARLREMAMGLTRIAAATQFGQLSQVCAGSSRMSYVEELLPVVLATHAEEVLPGYLTQPLKELLDVGEKEREQLVETVECYLRTGSVKTTAEQTFCHRNTVINRLKSFESCTGLSPLTLADGARIRMLLSVLPLHAAGAFEITR